MAREEKTKSGVDDALSLDVVYYSNPIPQNQAVLTILGAVFDKVHFPGVCMPLQGFDQKELDNEIKRIEELPGKMAPDEIILPMLKFVRHAKTLEGFCVFSGDSDIPSTTNHRPKWCGTFSMLFMGNYRLAGSLPSRPTITRECRVAMHTSLIRGPITISP